MIQINNLDFAYKKGKPIFSGLNLNLNPGHIYGLLGKNGAGKSTLLKTIAGLAFPTAGQCLVNGISAAKRQVSVLANIYFIAEDIYVPALTPGQFAKSTAGFYPKFSITDFYAHLKTLDVDPETPMASMSFGQQKKAIIGFGIATNTSILIMDEPTHGLDIPSKVQFRKLIASVLNDERCIIISTHQVRDLDNLIDSVLVLHERQIVLAQSLDEIAEKVSFGITTSTDYIYAEEGMGGVNAITINTDGSYSKVDMELLFNAITGNNKTLTSILNKA